MIRNRLKELDIKITELADYLQLSRTTMYKFIDAYESKNYSEVNKKVLKLFKYIDENDLIDKRNVINFILSKLTNLKEMEDDEKLSSLNLIRQYLINNPNSEKSLFIKNCCEKSSYDIFIHYIIEITPLLNKKKHSNSEKKLLEPYNQIVAIYTKNLQEE